MYHTPSTLSLNAHDTLLVKPVSVTPTQAHEAAVHPVPMWAGPFHTATRLDEVVVLLDVVVVVVVVVAFVVEDVVVVDVDDGGSLGDVVDDVVVVVVLRGVVVDVVDRAGVVAAVDGVSTGAAAGSVGVSVRTGGTVSVAASTAVAAEVTASLRPEAVVLAVAAATTVHPGSGVDDRRSSCHPPIPSASRRTSPPARSAGRALRVGRGPASCGPSGPGVRPGPVVAVGTGRVTGTVAGAA